MSATFAKEVQCSVCAYIMDHPVDACPVCGEPFYWLILARGTIQESQKTAFFQIMEDVVEGNIDLDFLQHGGHLWLPHNFWQYCADGSILETFPWILDVRLIQRPNPQKEQYFRDNPQAKPEPQEVHDQSVQPAAPAAPLQEPEDPRPVPALAAPAQPVGEPKLHFSVAQNQWSWDSLFRPLMIGLFFVFLAASYLALLYHRNTRTPTQAPPAEVTHEQQILP